MKHLFSAQTCFLFDCLKVQNKIKIKLFNFASALEKWKEVLFENKQHVALIRRRAHMWKHLHHFIAVVDWEVDPERDKYEQKNEYKFTQAIRCLAEKQ